MYIDENNDTLPSSAVCGSSDEVFRKTLGGSLEDKPARTIFQLIWPYTKNKQITKCPSDMTKNEVSYVLKKAVNDAWLDPKIKARNMNDYSWPAEQLMFYERGNYHWGADSGDVSDPSNPRKLGTTVNCAFWDGHVKTVWMPKVDDGEPDYYNADGKTGAAAKHQEIDPRRYCDTLN
jgi:prepilin-type processing-associated H-X9-DG protein